MMSDLLPVWGNAVVVAAYLGSRADSTLKLVPWGNAAANSLGLAPTHSVRLLAAPSSALWGNFVRQQRRRCLSIGTPIPPMVPVEGVTPARLINSLP